MRGTHHLMLSEAKDRRAHRGGATMLGYAQHDMATLNTDRTRTARVAQHRGLAITRSM
jgi:hypothetical protein